MIASIRSSIVSPSLLLFSVLACLPAAADPAADLRADLAFFADSSASRLREGLTKPDPAAFKSALLGKVAAGMATGSYDCEHRIASYKAYPSPRELGEALKLGDGFSRYENITGMHLDPGEHVVLVGPTKGRKISLLLPDWMRMPPAGTPPTKDPAGWGLKRQEFPLTEGLNIIQVAKPGLAYLSYFDDHAGDAPEITVHFPTGRVNGYFDAAKHTNADWDRLLDAAVNPVMDARGEHIQVAYPVDWFKTFTRGRGVELIRNYDRMLRLQYEFMGLVKYHKVPRNRILARVNHNYYMFRDGDGVAYLGNRGTMRMVADPDVVIKGDPCWGFNHEVGHVLQMRPQLTWGGMTEVSNNIMTLFVTTTLGNPSRLKEQGNYASAWKNIVKAAPRPSLLGAGDVFDRLVPFWQLHLYFSRNGKPDFYADVMEEMRRRPHAGTGNDSIRNQLEFTRICCDAAKLDLTDFFEQWGFYCVGTIELNDYRHYRFEITQAMVDETKAAIAAKGYPKPKEDITRVED